MITPKSDTWMNTSNKNIQTRQKNNILSTDYLIVDEISMATSELTALASGIAGKIKGETVDATAPFGGMNSGVQSRRFRRDSGMRFRMRFRGDES